MSSTRRVCLVGAGKVAQMHAPMVAQTRGVELVGVCDPDRARALRLADEHRIPHVFSSCEDAIASGTFDFAHVLVPPDRHVDLALALVHAGLGILIGTPRPSGRCAHLRYLAGLTGVRARHGAGFALLWRVSGVSPAGDLS